MGGTSFRAWEIWHPPIGSKQGRSWKPFQHQKRENEIFLENQTALSSYSNVSEGRLPSSTIAVGVPAGWRRVSCPVLARQDRPRLAMEGRAGGVQALARGSEAVRLAWVTRWPGWFAFSRGRPALGTGDIWSTSHTVAPDAAARSGPSGLPRRGDHLFGGSSLP